jgi:hypothetical protein
VSSRLVVATANILRDLSRSEAGDVLDAVLDEQPDLVALQEWDLPRLPTLRARGSLRLVPGPAWRLKAARPNPAYQWAATLVGGTAVGARTERFDLLEARAILLSGIGRTDSPHRRFGLEPPRVATLGRFRDSESGGTVSMIGYHLVPGVEADGRYREDRPRISDRHRREISRLQREIRLLRDQGDTVYAAGDSNFDGFRLEGLVSLWETRPGDPGTHGPRRKIDDVLSVEPATSVRLLTNASDHKAVLVTWGESDSR